LPYSVVAIVVSAACPPGFGVVCAAACGPAISARPLMARPAPSNVLRPIIAFPPVLTGITMPVILGRSLGWYYGPCKRMSPLLPGSWSIGYRWHARAIEPADLVPERRSTTLRYPTPTEFRLLLTKSRFQAELRHPS
jgi:hypothetical protein